MATNNQLTPAKRDSVIWLNIGAKKTGKTTETLSTSEAMWLKQGKPTLVLDIGSQSQYDHFDPVELEQLIYFDHFVRQAITSGKLPYFRCRTIDIDMFFECVNEYIVNTFVVFEDATSYMTGNLSKHKERLILNSRNLSNDYFFNLHSLSGPAPFLYLYSEYIILRQTTDNPRKLPAKVPAIDVVREAMVAIRAENAQLYPIPEQPKLAYRLINLQGL